MPTGIYHILLIQSRKLENAIVIAGSCADEPNASKAFCIIGTAITVPITARTINSKNYTKFGIKISLIFLFKASELSRYSTACCNAFVSDPDISPTLIILIYIGGKTDP